MGLDMYAYRTRTKPRKPVDFDGPLNDAGDETGDERIDYWRKFNNLHGWMERLYREKGGAQEFNCTPVELTTDDLDRLAREVADLKPARGFFFGDAQDMDAASIQDVLDFVEKARDALKAGDFVYYTAWW